MEAGPELDRRIADIMGGHECYRRIQGWCDGEHITRCGACGRHGHSNCYGDGRGPAMIACCDTLPAYSSDIAAAWALAERFHLVIRPSLLAGWIAGRMEAVTLGGQIVINKATYSEGRTAPHAICLAALKCAEIGAPIWT